MTSTANQQRAVVCPEVRSTLFRIRGSGNTPVTENVQRLLETERLVLQALCQGTPEGPVREAGKSLLNDYRWRELLHQLVFEVLMSLPTDSPIFIRDQLAPRLTRRGFPDVEFEDLFKPPSLSKEQAERLMRELAAGG